ncbi:HAMP domain-containing sensor histidine kinase [Methylocaldum sp.]|uniref:HAMP domain-containing sensor histidine kinase n=1 Tax=Methylocaldum sp. TaxID=1969727 RepID=UPI002D3C6EC4|nr:HAMP domain-containing sensor histidine kinase [Methylocaldum sp.]HYE36887.1 HAMP domain-containing sensor histidine kinase [Methylocaldum sp.]
MVVQDRDYWKNRVSVPGEMREVHKSGKPIRTKRRLAFVVFFGFCAFWLVQSHDGFGGFADRVTTLPTALKGVRASLEQTPDKLLKAESDNKMGSLVNELSEKKKLFYDQIVGFAADAKARLSIDEAFQGLQDAVNGFWQDALSRVDGAVRDLPEHSGAVRQDLLVKGAIVGMLVLICLGFGSGLLAVFTRSIRQLDESIRRLGAGDFGKPIRVTGPKNLRHLGDRLDWLRARLLGREESKQQFMSKVSNEFETPLSGIFESTGLLMAEAAGALNPEQRDLVARLSQDVQKLQNLFDESLHYNQVKDNPSPQPKNAVNMKTLLASVIEDYQDSLKAKSLTIKELVQPVEFFGVPDQVRTIVDNLLSNAIKFSPEGGKIRIILRDLGTGIQLEVEDDGPGIDATERPRIFEPFFRGKAAQTIDTEGAGLGLAIVSECVANHQGKVESIEPRQDEQGARIRVELPLVEAT